MSYGEKSVRMGRDDIMDIIWLEVMTHALWVVLLVFLVRIGMDWWFDNND